MMNEEERRRNDRSSTKGWNDPPMFSYEQLNKQTTSAVPLNRRYKYPSAEQQQLLNNQMYQQQSYMNNNLMGAQTGNFPNQYGQQTNYGPQSSLANPSLAYNQAPQMNPNTYQQQTALQHATNYGMGNYNQTGLQQSPYATMQNQYQAPIQQTTTPYGGQQSSILNQAAVVSQAQLNNQQLNYQTATQTSAYLPNVPNTSINTSASNQMMQTSGVASNYTNPMNVNNQYNQYGQLPPGQQMYAQQQSHQQMQQQYPSGQNHQFQY